MDLDENDYQVIEFIDQNSCILDPKDALPKISTSCNYRQGCPGQHIEVGIASCKFGFTGINIIPDGPLLYIFSQLTEKDLSHVAQISRRFNRLIDQHRDHLYAKEDFDSLTNKWDIIGIRWLIRCYPERKCSPEVLNWASNNGYTEIVRLLLEAKKPCTTWALDGASYYNHIEVVKLLLVAQKDCTTYALTCASASDHIEIVKLLLVAGSPYSDWALNTVSRQGNTEIVKLLLEAGKPCTTPAFDYASAYGYIEIVKLLLAADSPYSDCTVNALDEASLHGHKEIVKLLLAAGKPCTKKAIEYASKKCHTDIVNLLLDANSVCNEIKALYRFQRKRKTPPVSNVNTKTKFHRRLRCYIMEL